MSRLKFLGDIVLSTPVLDTLRERFPGARIEYLALAPHADVLRGHPSVDRLHVLPAAPGPADLLGLLRNLRRGPRIDWAFDLFNNPRSAVIMALSGARNRVGSDRGIRSRAFQHRRAGPDGDRSAIRHHLDKLVPLLGEMPPVRPTSLGIDPELAHAPPVPCPGPYTLLHPGSTWPEKAWPESRWAELAQAMERERFGSLVVVSPPGDRSLAGRVAEAAGASVLSEMSVSGLSSVIASARAYVGNDGGVLHMAVGHGIPTVGLFGPTEPDIWFPYEDFGPFRVVRGFDPAAGQGQSQLGPIAVEQVLSALHEVTGGAG